VTSKWGIKLGHGLNHPAVCFFTTHLGAKTSPMKSPLQLEVACDSYNLRHKNARPAQRYRCESNPDENDESAINKKGKRKKGGSNLNNNGASFYVYQNGRVLVQNLARKNNPPRDAWGGNKTIFFSSAWTCVDQITSNCKKTSFQLSTSPSCHGGSSP